MMRLLTFLSFVCVLAFCVAGTALAQPPTIASVRQADVVNPTVTAIDPATAYNDIDARVTITGAGFATDGTGVIPPAVTLGGVQLTDVTFVDDTTLVANVPWGMDGGTYDLTVTNPDGGTGSLAAAYTVTSGLGTWHAGTLFGGCVGSLLMKPGDPTTLYAEVPNVGSFRTTDAGENWTYLWGAEGGGFVLDPLHPTWVYGFFWGETPGAGWGFYRSTDEGDTWTLVEVRSSEHYPDYENIYPSSHDPQTLYISSCLGWDYVTGVQAAAIRPRDTTAYGLIRSSNGGKDWSVVADLVGVSVSCVAYHPTDPLQLVAGTTDGTVYRSTDGGVHWSEAAKPAISNVGVIAYDPYDPEEVWVAGSTWASAPGGICHSTDAACTAWADLTPGAKSTFIDFVSDGTIYVSGNRSTNGGATWDPFVPDRTASGVLCADPDDPDVVYAGDTFYGVWKTTTRGTSWGLSSQGLTGMYCYGMAVSRADPLRIWANFGWPWGVHYTTDGAGTWQFASLPGMGNPEAIAEDSFDTSRVYLAASTGFYTSTDAGVTWSGWAWSATPSLAGWQSALASDPNQPGRLSMTSGGILYASTDYGASWVPAPVPAGVTDVRRAVFDPSMPGLVYLATGGTGVWRSSDDGATWKRLDDAHEPGMASALNVYIATHPRRALFVTCDNSDGYCSYDDGATWEWVEGTPGWVTPDFTFANGDSTRLYAASWGGLYFSSDVGAHWQRAAGTLGRVGVTDVDWANADGRTIIYAAATGGVVSIGGGSTSADRRGDVAGWTKVDPGVYRRVVLKKTKTLRSIASQDGWVREEGWGGGGGTVNAGATTLRIGDDAERQQYRDVLSFATGAALPDHAVITRVQLRVRKQGVAGGGNPMSAFGGVRLDVKRGVFGTPALQSSDFQPTITTQDKYCGPFKPAAVHGWYSINLIGARKYVNMRSASSGRTQIRLYFSRDDNNDNIANYLSLYSGNARSSLRPQLIVTYFVP
jgi:hypothetical protein